MYSGTVHVDTFALAAAGSPFPVVYNGDLFTAEDIRAFEAAHPETEAVMLGRGAAADPRCSAVCAAGRRPPARSCGSSTRSCTRRTAPSSAA